MQHNANKIHTPPVKPIMSHIPKPISSQFYQICAQLIEVLAPQKCQHGPSQKRNIESQKFYILATVLHLYLKKETSSKDWNVQKNISELQPPEIFPILMN